MDTIINLYEERNLSTSKINSSTTIFRPLSLQKKDILDFIKHNFNEKWGTEAEMAFSNVFPTIFVALSENKLVGFCCYDVTNTGFLGPLGVIKDFRNMDIGALLVDTTLNAMREVGYAYTIVGSCSNALDFYINKFNAQIIESSYHNSVYDRLFG